MTAVVASMFLVPSAALLRNENAAGDAVTMPASNLTLYAIWDFLPVNMSTNDWIKGTSDGFVMTVDKGYNESLKVTCNGNLLVKDTDYEVKEGSTIVTILPAYLESLGEGTHVFDTEFKGGLIASAAMTVSEPTENDPDDGNDNTALLPIAIAVIIRSREL